MRRVHFAIFFGILFVHFSDALGALPLVDTYIMTEISVGPQAYGLLFAASVICAAAILTILFPVLLHGSDDLTLLRALNHMALFIKFAMIPFFVCFFILLIGVLLACFVFFIFIPFLLICFIAMLIISLAYVYFLAMVGSAYSFAVIRSRRDTLSHDNYYLLYVLQAIPVLDVLSIILVHDTLRNALNGAEETRSDEDAHMENNTPPD